MLALVVAGGGGDKDGLWRQALELVEAQRPVVQGRGQTETVFHQVFLAGTVALVHAAELGNGDVGFVDHQQGVVGQIIEQGRWRLAGLAPGQVARVVLDPGAITQLLHHFDIKLSALLQALGLHQLVVVAQLGETLTQLVLDMHHGIQNGLARGHIVALGIDGQARHLAQHLARERIEIGQVLDFVIEQLHAHRLAVRFRRKDIDDPATHPIGGARQFHIITGVLQLRQAAQDETLIHLLAAHQVQHHAQIGARITETVDGRHRSHQHRVATLQQGLGGRQTHLLDVFVDRGILLDEGIRGRHIGLGLVVIVVGDEVFHGIVRKEFAHLAVQLRCQGFVGGQDQGRALHLLHDIGDGKGLTRAGDPKQGLVHQTVGNALFQLANRLGLIPGRLHGRL